MRATNSFSVITKIWNCLNNVLIWDFPYRFVCMPIWSNLHPISDNNNDIIKLFAMFEIFFFHFVTSTGTCAMHTLKSLKKQDIVIHCRHLDDNNNKFKPGQKDSLRMNWKNLSFQMIAIFYITIKHGMTWHGITLEPEKKELYHSSCKMNADRHSYYSLNPLMYLLSWWHGQSATVLTMRLFEYKLIMNHTMKINTL